MTLRELRFLILSDLARYREPVNWRSIVKELVLGTEDVPVVVEK